MSKGQTSSDNDGWKRGEKGFGKASHASNRAQYTTPNYDKTLLKPTMGQKAVGQRANVGSGSKLNQRDY